ncbi:MAG: hypothetical protein ACI9WC_002392 [Arenicella sp.]
MRREFRIFEIEFSEEDVTKLIADFVQFCDSQIVPLRGSIYFDSANTPSVYQAPILDASDPSLAVTPLTTSGGVIRMERDDGDSIAGGQDYLFDNSNSSIQVSRRFGSNRGVNLRLDLDGSSSSWNFSFLRGNLNIDPNKDQPLSVGLYRNAFRAAFSDPFAGVSVSSPGNGCNTSAGQFRIFEIDYDSNGDVEKLVADFYQNCGRLENAPRLKGTIHWDSTLA